MGIIDKSTKFSPLDEPEWNSLTDAQKVELDEKMAVYAAMIDPWLKPIYVISNTLPPPSLCY
jgi:hypothetical protein